MKSAKLKVSEVMDNTVYLDSGSFSLSFSKRSPAVSKSDKFLKGDEWELKLKKVAKKEGKKK